MVRTLTGIGLALCLGCGPSPAILLQTLYGQRDLARAADGRHRECVAVPVGRTAIDPCAKYLQCLDAVTAVVKDCDDAVRAQAQGVSASGSAARCQGGAVGSRATCALAGVP